MTGDLSGWWRRAGAWTIDTVIVLAMTIAVEYLVGREPWMYVESEFVLVTTAADEIVFLLINGAVACAYYTPQMLRWEGRSLGKRACGIRVVRPDGEPLTAARILVRQGLVQYLLWGFVPLASLLDYLWPLGDRENRALHDLAAGTRVVRA